MAHKVDRVRPLTHPTKAMFGQCSVCKRMKTVRPGRKTGTGNFCERCTNLAEGCMGCGAKWFDCHCVKQAGSPYGV